MYGDGRGVSSTNVNEALAVESKEKDIVRALLRGYQYQKYELKLIELHGALLCINLKVIVDLLYTMHPSIIIIHPS